MEINTIENRKFREVLIEDMKAPEEARAYLMALCHVAEAQKRIGRLDE